MTFLSLRTDLRDAAKLDRSCLSVASVSQLSSMWTNLLPRDTRNHRPAVLQDLVALKCNKRCANELFWCSPTTIQDVCTSTSARVVSIVLDQTKNSYLVWRNGKYESKFAELAVVIVCSRTFS